MTSQMGNANPRRNHKSGVGGDPRETLSTRLSVPSDKGVTRLCFPGRRTEEQPAQEPALRIADQILELLPDRVAQAQVVMLGDEALEDHKLIGIFADATDRQRRQMPQRSANQSPLMLDQAQRTIARAVNRGLTTGRQNKQPPLLELQQQRAACHVFDPSRAVAPVPCRAQFPREPRPMPIGMFAPQTANKINLRGPYRAALNNHVRAHQGTRYTLEAREYRTK